MNKEKLEALEVLKEACNKVTDAMNAIEDFADSLGVQVEFEKDDGKVTIAELAEMVSEEIGMKPSCAFVAIACAFDLIKDLDLTVVMEEDEDDE